MTHTIETEPHPKAEECPLTDHTVHPTTVIREQKPLYRHPRLEHTAKLIAEALKTGEQIPFGD
jgi:hypothetical protein